MRVRYKPWAEDYLKDHPDLVDMDGSHAGHIDEWFDKSNLFILRLARVWDNLLQHLPHNIQTLILCQWNVKKRHV